MFLPRLLILPILLATGIAKPAFAQIGVYGMGSGDFLGTATAAQGSLVAQQSGFSAYGGTFGLYDNLARLGPLKLGADARYFKRQAPTATPTETSCTEALPVLGWRSTFRFFR